MKQMAVFLILMCLLPGVALCESLEKFREIKAKSEASEITADEDVKIIPKSIIVERIRSEGSVAFSSDVVLFDYGSWKLRDASHRQLLEIAAALSDPSLKRIPFFYVDGHTCNIGSEENNCILSWRRARSVINFLVNAGDVPRNRLVARGFGENEPVAPNTTEAERKKNRRVVLERSSSDNDREERGKICP